MSEGEVSRLSKAIEELSKKTDRQHEDNQKQAARDRETFADAMNKQRELFQEALNKQFLEAVALDRKVERSHVLLEQCVGNGHPGEGRLGIAENTIEMLLKFRWQATAVISTVLLLADKADKIATLLHK